MTTKTLRLFEVETDHGFFYCTEQKNDYSRPNTDWLLTYFFNGRNPVLSFHKDWVKIPEKLVTLETIEKQDNINYRHELIDITLESDNIPAVVPAIPGSKSWEYFIPKEYGTIASLYQLKSDPQPDILVPVEFEIVNSFKVDSIDESTFSYPIVIKNPYDYEEERKVITEKHVTHQLADQLVFPDIALASRPCKLTSNQMYAIIREHVKRNIDSKYAQVSSDYDFHFEVKKRLELPEVETYTVDVNNSWFSGRKRKPKYEKRYQKYREVTILNIQTQGRNNDFSGATFAPVMEAKNTSEMQEKIDKYLEDLMNEINEPVKDCATCNGRGVIVCRVSVKPT